VHLRRRRPDEPLQRQRLCGEDLIQHLIRWVAKTGPVRRRASEALLSVLDTEISPELVPADATGAIQSTQAKVGALRAAGLQPLHITRFGLRPSKVAFLPGTLGRTASGPGPPNFPDETRNAYDLATIKKWLGVFLFRFFEISQFKRSAMPNGPKVISGGALSPAATGARPSTGRRGSGWTSWKPIVP
jgi:NAD+ synthase (glutamine-hydrolysing)